MDLINRIPVISDKLSSSFVFLANETGTSRFINLLEQLNMMEVKYEMAQMAVQWSQDKCSKFLIDAGIVPSVDSFNISSEHDDESSAKTFKLQENYESLITFLRLKERRCKIVFIGNGQGLYNQGRLFDVHIYPMKTSGVTVISGELRKTPIQPIQVIQLYGRCDIVCLHENADVESNRANVKYAISVKPEGFDHSEALREGFLQLMGLNADNALHSPPVLVTDLDSTHYVLYLERHHKNLFKYYLRVAMVPSLALAAQICSVIGVRDCITHTLGRRNPLR